jgi:hypothetical protein
MVMKTGAGGLVGSVVAFWQAENNMLAIRARLRKAKTFLDMVTPFLLVGLYLIVVALLCLTEEPILEGFL